MRNDVRHARAPYTRAMMGRGANVSPASFLLSTTSNEAGSSCARSRVVGTVIRNCEPPPRRNLPTSSIRSSDRCEWLVDNEKTIAFSLRHRHQQNQASDYLLAAAVRHISNLGWSLAVEADSDNNSRLVDRSVFCKAGSSIWSLARAISARAAARRR